MSLEYPVELARTCTHFHSGVKEKEGPLEKKVRRILRLRNGTSSEELLFFWETLATSYQRETFPRIETPTSVLVQGGPENLKPLHTHFEQVPRTLTVLK